MNKLIIETVNKDHKYELKLNETILLLDRDDHLRILFYYTSANVTNINFYFEVDSDPPAKQKIIFNESGIDIHLTNWFHNQWIGNNSPIEFNIGHWNYKLQFRSDAAGHLYYRSLTVSIWQKIIQ